MRKKIPTVKYNAVNNEHSAERIAVAYEVLFAHVLKEWRSRQRDKTSVKVDNLKNGARIK